MFGANNNSNNNSYDSSSAAFSGSQINGEGGGFSQAQSGQEQATSKKSAQNAGERKLVPLTIKQILTAPEALEDADFMVDGVVISQLVLVALVTGINVQSSHTSYKIHDGSSEIEAKMWSGDNSNKAQSITENMYVRVIGKVNIFRGWKSVNAFRIDPVTDMNEMTEHFLLCIQAHLHNTLPKKNQPGLPANNANSNSNSNSNSNNNGNGNGNGNDLQSVLGSGMEDNSLTGRVYKVVKGNTDSRGCSVDSIVRNLAGTNINDIRGAIEELTGDGKLYSTVDDEHFSITY